MCDLGRISAPPRVKKDDHTLKSLKLNFTFTHSVRVNRPESQAPKSPRELRAFLHYSDTPLSYPPKNPVFG